MKSLAIIAALTPLLSRATSQASGSGTTTRYWDCCKPSCAWPDKAPLASGPLGTCDIDDNPLEDGGSTASGCEDGGGAFMCSGHSPWEIDENLAYGWAAVNIGGQTEADWCCSCYELTFTDGPVSGKKMIVQATNTGGDLGADHFDIAIPGGGVGIFNACTTQWGAPENGWGQRYGGISSREECEFFPEKLQPGCFWRFDWFGGADNPGVTFQEIDCPAEVVAKSGCQRSRTKPSRKGFRLGIGVRVWRVKKKGEEACGKGGFGAGAWS